jgi:serine/threonine protein kinase
LAVVAYEMLTGQLPFGGEMDIVLVRQHLEETPRPLRHANPHMPGSLEKIIGGALSKDPRQRPASARAFVEQIQTAGEDREAADGQERSRRGGLVRWGLLVPAVIVLMALLAGTLLFAVPILQTTPTPTPTCTLTPTITPSSTATTNPTFTPSSTPTETLVPTATPRPTSTPTPTRPPPPQAPTPTPSAEGTHLMPTGAGRPHVATLGRFTYPPQGATLHSLAQGDAYA